MLKPSVHFFPDGAYSFLVVLYVTQFRIEVWHLD